jgi:hypothetical protein
VASVAAQGQSWQGDASPLQARPPSSEMVVCKCLTPDTTCALHTQGCLNSSCAAVVKQELWGGGGEHAHAGFGNSDVCAVY